MGLTKCCCCVDLLKGVKILGIVLIVMTGLSIIVTIVSVLATGAGSLIGLIATVPGLNFSSIFVRL